MIRASVRVTYPWHLTVGDRVQIGDEARLYSLGQISIGSDSVISQRSYICAGDHDHTSIEFLIRARAVSIGAEAWLGADTFVAPGVSIGDGTVVGARSSVFRDLPTGMICYGSPCVPVKPRIVKME